VSIRKVREQNDPIEKAMARWNPTYYGKNLSISIEEAAINGQTDSAGI
jgi:hypothetical protein